MLLFVGLVLGAAAGFVWWSEFPDEAARLMVALRALRAMASKEWARRPRRSSGVAARPRFGRAALQTSSARSTVRGTGDRGSRILAALELAVLVAVTAAVLAGVTFGAGHVIAHALAHVRAG